ncbi:MAG: hypothetical protein Kow0065_15710 [Methylomicrobium sp.]
MKQFHSEVSASYLQQAAETFFPIKEYSYQCMEIAPGRKLLDLGCGPGVDLKALCELSDHESHIVGVDYDRHMLMNAAEYCRQYYRTGRLSLINAKADDLPFFENYFDSCRSERLFMHLQAPEEVLREIKRIVKPQGVVVVAETDWASLSIDTQLPSIERILSHYRMTHLMNNGYSGRSLYRQFKQAGFADIDMRVFPIHVTDLSLFYSLSIQQAVEERALVHGALTQREFDDWREDLSKSANEGCFYACINTIVISARKP